MDESKNQPIRLNLSYPEIYKEQARFYQTGATRLYEFRVEQLKKLKKMLKHYEDDLLQALKKDLGKSPFEGFASEVGACVQEISHTLKNLKDWMAPKKVDTGILNFPSSGKLIAEPYGQTLIISPWNYPVLLALSPMIGAIAAGNTVFLKLSEISQYASEVLKKALQETFPSQFIFVDNPAVDATTEILKLPFDYLFFTGSPAIGKIVMEAASKHLTPVTLELGGKSPCIVDKEVDLEVAVKRIIWGKFFNTGQTCVAPDYLYVHENHYEEFLSLAQKAIGDFYGDNPKSSSDYGRIINQKHFKRLEGLINPQKVYCGGEADIKHLYIAPTILHGITWDDEVMQEEIFGPLLPILCFENLNEVIEQINKRPKPLALYLFSQNSFRQDLVLESCSFGGGCLNDTLVHLTETQLPFGGVGNSGMGSYNGYESFKTFTHQKSVLYRESWYDNPVRYPPYKGKLKFLKIFFR